MAHPDFIPQYRRLLAAVLAVVLGLGPLATPAYAAVTLLGDQPLNAQNQAKPNIMLTVDDSTSMLFDYLPDTVIDQYCRGITGRKDANCGFAGQNIVGRYVTPGHIFQQYGIPFSAYNPAFDPSGPGAGCAGAACSPGISPAPSPTVLSLWTLYPGIERYPAGSPKAGTPYEYWTLWPAVAHNSEFNHVYYNPRQQYDPPLNADGSSFPQMDSAYTSAWTRVPADFWGSPVQRIDLTTPVTVGLWCNSDWSVGNETDPAYCRTNGTGGDATQSMRSSPNGDYSYPWAPMGIDPTSRPTTAMSIAYSKVDASGTILAAWNAEAQDPKYFYENDNVLWCDPTASLWPHHGAPIPQTCIGGSTVPQSCINRVSQTCSAGLPQTCDGASADTCVGARTNSCGPTTPQVCGSATPQTCVAPPPPVCVGAGTQTCDSVSTQTCDAVTQTCGGIAGQTCNNVRSQVCNITSPTCISACTDTWQYQAEDGSWVNDMTGYCPCTGDECRACRLQNVCTGSCSNNGSVACTLPSDISSCPVNAGSCSIVGNPCSATSEAQCPTQGGTCSVDGTPGCFADGDCAAAGHCSAQTLNVCHTAGPDPSECPTIGGHCSVDGQTCTVPGSDPANCVDAGHCSLLTGTACHTAGSDPGECPAQPGICQGVGGSCFIDNDCIRSPHCSATTGTACTMPGSADPACPPVGGTCDVDGRACSIDGDCGDAGHCTDPSMSTVVCHTPGPDPSECPDIAGTCQLHPTQNCNATSPCPPMGGGHCSHFGNACDSVAQCPNYDQTCSMTGEACTSNIYQPYCTWDWGGGVDPSPYQQCNEPSHCPIQGGTCSVDGTACPMTSPPNYYFGAAYGWVYDLSHCNPAVTVGHCSLDTGVSCTSVNDPVCVAHDGPSGTATCSDMLDDNSRSLYADANGAGAVCRHNNRLAGAYTSGPTTYPSGRFTRPVTGGTGVNACVASPRYAAVQRHYWKTGVEWCDGAVTTPPDKWLNYGSRDFNCQDSQDATHVYPRFYKFGQPATTSNETTPAFERVDLIPGATFHHVWTDDDGLHDITHSYAEEMNNYANWFAYYRTRIQAVKTVTSASFSEVDATYRVGFHAMFSLPSFLNIQDFDSTVQKPAWFAKLFGVTIPLGQETPTLTAIARIGDYFKDGSHPQLSGSTDPIQLSCQQNFHMLFTDGFTNQSGLPITQVANVDDVVPSGSIPGMSGKPVGLTANPIVGLTQGADWPRPYREDKNVSPVLNSLADYALAYWVTDLRPGMPDNVPTSNTPPVAADRYSAKWQHLNFAALSLGTSGVLPAGDQVVTELDLKNPAGTLQWPRPNPVNHPSSAGVDDLWHAAINGHGDFVNADSIEEVKLGIGKILAGVTNLPGTATSVGFVSNTFGASANFIYRPRFEQSWSGSLAKLQIDPVTGVPLLIPPIWNTSDQLTAITSVADGWRTGRRIVTMNALGVPIPFLWDSLSVSQRDSLAPGKPDAKTQAILQFLRGDRSKEGERVGRLRVRASPMGDIVDSSPVYVGPPNAAYLDSNDMRYSTFKSTNATRAPHLYIGGNDGMLHVIDDSTGSERWAYVPTPLFRGGLAATLAPVPNDPKTGLGALAYQDGALPAFRHHFYVDATPKVADVDFSNGLDGSAWTTLLVGGLGKGGNRYYALNITDPAAVTDETSAKDRILWEFPPVGVSDGAREMGYTYGKPIIAKTRPGPEWQVIVGSGYNSPSGEGKLYFLRAKDARLDWTMATGAGTAGNPAGLAHPAGYTQDFHNQLAEQIYAGDLLGKFWRFDVSGGSYTDWSTGQLANLISPSGGPQPVTTTPEIKIDVDNGIDRWVFVGTGKLYDETDLASTQTQTMYAFRDGTAVSPWALPATPLDQSTVGMVAIDPLDPAHNFGLANVPDKGWYHNLATGRIVVAPQAAFGVVAYIVTKPPSADLCAIGLPVTIYAREYGTGQSLLTANADGTGALQPGIDIAEGGVGLQIVTFQSADGGATATPDVRLAITLPDGSVRYFKPRLPKAFFQHRMSWRLLGQ